MGKKKLAGWQFGVLLGFQILLFCTMFMPFIGLKDKAIDKMVSEANSYASMDGESFDENEVAKTIKDNIENLEKENGIKITSITPVRIMTHSAFKFLAGNRANDPKEKEAYDEDVKSDKITQAYVKGYNTLRALFFVVYIIDLIIIIMTILAFALSWSNLVGAILNTIYGLIVSIIFGILRFGLVKIAVGKIKSAAGMLGGLANLAGQDDLSETISNLSKALSKILSYLYGVGPLLAFILGICIFIMGIVCIFAGASANTGYVPVDPTGDDPFGPPIDPIPPQPPIPTPPQPIPTPPQPIPTPPQPPIPTPPIQPVPQASVGKVMCTKGVAVGQGFQLPVDRKVIVGKSPTRANLVISNPNVSNIHCSIRYNAAHNSYIIKDHSTNGTFVNGVKLPKDSPVEYPAGTVLSLADGTNQITLG